MGLLDTILGRTKVKQPARDRLFAMSTAYVTLETSLGLTHRNGAGIVFQPLATADFEGIVKDTDDLLRSAAQDGLAIPAPGSGSLRILTPSLLELLLVTTDNPVASRGVRTNRPMTPRYSSCSHPPPASRIGCGVGASASQASRRMPRSAPRSCAA